MKRPAWARMKVRFYIAVCWVPDLDDERQKIVGVNWFHDKLMFVCLWFHEYFFERFCPDKTAYPLAILERYED